MLCFDQSSHLFPDLPNAKIQFYQKIDRFLLSVWKRLQKLRLEGWYQKGRYHDNPKAIAFEIKSNNKLQYDYNELLKEKFNTREKVVKL